MNSESIAAPRAALFIDGSSLLYAAKSLGFDIDFKRLLDEFRCDRFLVRAHYYTVIHESQASASIRPLVDWLTYNGFVVSTRTIEESIDTNSGRAAKRSLDVQLAVNAMELAKHVDQIIIFSGSGDFRALAAAFQRRGKHVTVVSTVATNPPMVADQLRRQADLFVDLLDLKSRIARPGAPQAEGPVARPRRQHDE